MYADDSSWRRWDYWNRKVGQVVILTKALSAYRKLAALGVSRRKDDLRGRTSSSGCSSIRCQSKVAATSSCIMTHLTAIRHRTHYRHFGQRGAGIFSSDTASDAMRSPRSTFRSGRIKVQARSKRRQASHLSHSITVAYWNHASHIGYTSQGYLVSTT